LDTLALDTPDPSILFDMPVVRAGKAVLRHAAVPKISYEAKKNVSCAVCLTLSIYNY